MDVWPGCFFRYILSALRLNDHAHAYRGKSYQEKEKGPSFPKNLDRSS